jgi:hypothetical protein
MWMTRPAATMRLERWAEADIAHTLNTMQAVFNKAPAGDGYYVSAPGMFHVNFTDGPYYIPLAPLLDPPLAGPIHAHRGFDIVNKYSVAFFDQHVQGRPAALLDGSSKRYPEVDTVGELGPMSKTRGLLLLARGVISGPRHLCGSSPTVSKSPSPREASARICGRR